MHRDPHPKADRLVLINVHPDTPITSPDGQLSGLLEFYLVDWADRVLGYDPMDQWPGLLVVNDYVKRALSSVALEESAQHLPSNDTIYGYVYEHPCIVHVSELHD